MMKHIFIALSRKPTRGLRRDQQSTISTRLSLHQKTSFLKVSESRKPTAIFILCCIAVALFQMTGCTVTFTQSDTLQFSLSEPAEETLSIVAEFEAGEAESIAGDVTQKAGSACAGGACIIY